MRVAVGTAWFVAGFTAVFVALSLVMSAAWSMMGGLSRYINAAAGIVVALLGVNIIVDFLPFLHRERRFHLSRRLGGAAGGFLIGAAFGAGWTPCIGPILGSILLLAGQSGGLGQAALYLAAYSLGLGLPFLAAALFFDRFLRVTAALKKHILLINRLSGVMLIVVGVFMCLGQFQALNALIMRAQFNFIDWARESGGAAAKALALWLEFLLGV
jgi:cytochrome c-type biogenesis protein